MHNKLTYKTRPTSGIARQVFCGSLIPEALGRLRAPASLTLEEDAALSFSPVRRVRETAAVSFESLAEALGDIHGSSISSTTLYNWSQGKYGPGKNQDEMERIAPLSALVLNPWGGLGPVDRFFMAIDAVTMNQCDWDISGDEAEILGYLVASRVQHQACRAWGTNAGICGRELPPGENGEEINSNDLLADVRPLILGSGAEIHQRQNIILWVLQRALSFRRTQPQASLPVAFALDLAALGLVGMLDGQDYLRTAEHDKPRAQLAAEIVQKVFFPLTWDAIVVSQLEGKLLRTGLAGMRGSAAELAGVILDARQSLLGWLEKRSVSVADIDRLLDSAVQVKRRQTDSAV